MAEAGEGYAIFAEAERARRILAALGGQRAVDIRCHGKCARGVVEATGGGRHFFVDHPRGSGNTSEISLLALMASRHMSTRLVILISDRRDLDLSLRLSQTLRFKRTRGIRLFN